MAGKGSGTHEDERARRLAAALRENLRRRKAQAREREARGGQGTGEAEAGDSGPAVAGTTLPPTPDAP